MIRTTQHWYTKWKRGTSNTEGWRNWSIFTFYWYNLKLMYNTSTCSNPEQGGMSKFTNHNCLVTLIAFNCWSNLTPRPAPLAVSFSSSKLLLVGLGLRSFGLRCFSWICWSLLLFGGYCPELHHWSSSSLRPCYFSSFSCSYSYIEYMSPWYQYEHILKK